jgi:hypothetical protein
MTSARPVHIADRISQRQFKAPVLLKPRPSDAGIHEQNRDNQPQATLEFTNT